MSLHFFLKVLCTHMYLDIFHVYATFQQVLYIKFRGIINFLRDPPWDLANQNGL